MLGLSRGEAGTSSDLEKIVKMSPAALECLISFPCSLEADILRLRFLMKTTLKWTAVARHTQRQVLRSADLFPSVDLPQKESIDKHAQLLLETPRASF